MKEQQIENLKHLLYSFDIENRSVACEIIRAILETRNGYTAEDKELCAKHFPAITSTSILDNIYLNKSKNNDLKGLDSVFLGLDYFNGAPDDIIFDYFPLEMLMPKLNNIAIDKVVYVKSDGKEFTLSAEDFNERELEFIKFAAKTPYISKTNESYRTLGVYTNTIVKSDSAYTMYDHCNYKNLLTSLNFILDWVKKMDSHSNENLFWNSFGVNIPLFLGTTLSYTKKRKDPKFKKHYNILYECLKNIITIISESNSDYVYGGINFKKQVLNEREERKFLMERDTNSGIFLYHSLNFEDIRLVTRKEIDLFELTENELLEGYSGEYTVNNIIEFITKKILDDLIRYINTTSLKNGKYAL